MKIVLTNDDGYEANGFQCLIDILSEEHQICVLVPKTQQSAKSQSMTLCEPIEFVKCENPKCVGFISTGTPADCMSLGLPLIKQELDFVPDLVVSGINLGANLGMDVHRSGTFGAAREARINGIPAIAISLIDRNEPLENMKTRFGNLIKQLPNQLVNLKTSSLILNINIPSGLIKGIKLCDHDSVSFYDFTSKIVTNEKHKKYTLNYIFQENKNYQKDADIDYLLQGYITFTYIDRDFKVNNDVAYGIDKVDVKQVKE